MTIGLTAGLLTVLAVLAVIFLPVLHPAQLWAVPWALVALLFLARLLPYPDPSSLTCWLIILASLGFTTATLIGGWLAPSRVSSPSQLTDRAVFIAAAASTTVALLGMCVFIAVVASRFGLRAAMLPTAAVRLGLREGAIPVAIKYLYVAFAAAALAPIAARRANSPRGKRYWLALTAACIGSTYFSTGRANLAIASIISIVAFLLSGPSPRRRTVLVAASAGAVLSVTAFVVLGDAIGKSFSNNEISSLNTVFSRHAYLRPLGLPYQYLTEPIAALDNEVRASGPWGTEGGCADLATICQILRVAGFDSHPVPLIRPRTFAPLAINIYTGLDLPLLDGGRALAVGIIAVEGLLVGLLWGWARSREPLALASYAICSWAVVFSYSQNDLFAPHLLGALLVASVLLVVGRRLAPASLRRRAQQGSAATVA